MRNVSFCNSRFTLPSALCNQDPWKAQFSPEKLIQQPLWSLAFLLLICYLKWSLGSELLLCNYHLVLAKKATFPTVLLGGQWGDPHHLPQHHHADGLQYCRAACEVLRPQELFLRLQNCMTGIVVFQCS